MVLGLRRVFAATFCILFFWSASAHAVLVSVDWAIDQIADGIASGVFTSTGLTAANQTPTIVSVTSTDGPFNGGQTFLGIGGLNYDAIAATSQIPGIASNTLGSDGQPLIRNGAVAVDWSAGQTGFLNIEFGGKFVRDPVFAFTFANPNSDYDFADDITLALIDESVAGSTQITASNTVLSGVDGLVNSGFAIQALGIFQSIQLITNAELEAANADLLTLFVEEENIFIDPPAQSPVSAVPTPAALPLLGSALLGFGLLRLKQRIRGS